MPTRRPFQQLRFADVPARPARPHPYFEASAREVTTRSEGLGVLRIRYRVAGEGPPLLLIHGLMTTSYSWRYVIEPLGRKFRLFMPDLPGAGESEAPPEGAFGPARIAAWIGDFQRAVGIEGCDAVGNSMGGYLCMRHALARPAAFSSLVNIHSPAFPDLRLDALAKLMKLPGTRALTAYLARRDPLRWAHRNVHYFDETLKSLEEAHAYGDPLATADGSRAFASYLAETLAPAEMRDFVAVLRKRRRDEQPFPTRLMLLYSRRDPLVSPANGEKLHALLPDARMVWLTDSSHFAHVDSPERVAREVIAFAGAGDEGAAVAP